MATATWQLSSARPFGKGAAPVRVSALVARRRRAALTLVLLLAALGVAAVAVVGSLATDVAADQPALAVERVVVGPGDTIWSLALPYAPAGTDARSYVAAVLEHNDVQPGALQPGMVLELPLP